MLVIEEPTIYDEVAEPGTFVVIAVDPVASTLLLDDEAKREAAQIAPTRCLALVDGSANSEYVAGMRRLSPVFLLAGKGIPRRPNSWAAVPVAPTGPHPETGRCPVTTVPPLPWTDCYIHTLAGLPGLVSRLYQHRVIGPALLPKDYHGLIYTVSEDESRWAREQNARIAQELEANPPTHTPVSPPLSEIPTTDDASSGPISDRWLGGPVESEPPQLKLAFEMWIDTSSLDELADPERVASDVRRLQQIEVDWARRVVAAQLQERPALTKAWLESIGDAGAPSEDPEVSSESSSPSDLEELIRPEDALEHRVERDSATGAVTSRNNTASTHGSSVTSASASSRQDGSESRKHRHFAGKYLSVFRSLFSGASSVFKLFRPFSWGILLRKLFY